MMDNIRPLHTEADYDWALQEIEPYFLNEPEPGSTEADRFEILATLIEAYEANHWTIEAEDPVAIIQHYMELRNKTRADLGALLGSRSRASEILNRKRQLTLPMIYKLNHEWGIPAEVLIVPYHIDAAQ